MSSRSRSVAPAVWLMALRPLDYTRRLARLFARMAHLRLQLEVHRDRGGGFYRLSVEQRGLVAPLADGIHRRLHQIRVRGPRRGQRTDRAIEKNHRSQHHIALHTAGHCAFRVLGVGLIDELRWGHTASNANAMRPGGIRGRRALTAHHYGFLYGAEIDSDIESKRTLAVYLEPANRRREPARIHFQPVQAVGERPKSK